MKKRSYIFAAVIAAISFTSAPAFASCWFSGKPTHIWTYSSNNYTTVYTHNGSYFTYFRVYKSDPELLNNVRNAALLGRDVSGYGNAASCPTSGTYRYGGYLTYAYVYTG